MGWGKSQIDLQAVRTAEEDYAAFEMMGLSEIEGATVLDVGCFDGFNTVLKFAPYSSVSHVVGIDPDPEALDEARSRTDDPRFDFIESSFEGYESDEQFDLVYFSHVLQHLEDPVSACRKAFELAKPGGWVIVKTVDDSLKLSHPDPENVMRKLFALYEEHVLPNTEHTRFTDRYVGRKCYALMRAAGFRDVSVRSFSVDTAGKTHDERMGLFERCVYFRRSVPADVNPEIAARIAALVREWGKLFESEDYYFMSQSLVVVGRKPGGNLARRCAEKELDTAAGRIRPMAEADLGAVMAIEVEAFPSPWTPVAYAMDLRHNPAAHYDVMLDERGSIVGYLGWWLLDGCATIMRVASSRQARRAGVGSTLVENACANAGRLGARVMQLEVRSSNEAARALYEKLGFENAGVIPRYYSSPDEDAVVMAKSLS